MVGWRTAVGVAARLPCKPLGASPASSLEHPFASPAVSAFPLDGWCGAGRAAL